MRYLLQLAYKGTNFSGYQRQPDKRTVQGVLEDAINKVFGEEIVSFASGRTDAGVHALGQMVHFDSDKLIDFSSLKYSLNSLLPDDVRVVKIIDGGQLHARYSAKHKRYGYTFYVDDCERVMLVDRAYFVYGDLNVRLMRRACRLFKGEHDFKSFQATGSTAKTTVRTIYDCRIVYDRMNDTYRIEVEGNGFLYKMVRFIAGSLIKVGKGKLSLEQLKDALDGGDLPKNIVLPSHALTLLNVKYD